MSVWPRQLITAVFLMLACLSAGATVVSSFIETFGGGTYDHAAWTPLNAGSALTLLSSSVDRDKLDGVNDGALLVERGVGVAGTYGARLTLGTVDVSDIGASLSLDFSYERPRDSFQSLRPVFALNGTAIAEGAGVSLFSAGNDPAGAKGLYSAVLVRVRTFISADDVGKELSVAIQYYDGNATQERDLVLDAVSFINTSDSIPATQLTGMLAKIGRRNAFEVSFPRRTNALLPPLQYRVQTSTDLNPWSWSGSVADESGTTPLGGGYDQYSERFLDGANARQFYRVVVQNRRIGDPGITFDPDKVDTNFPQMLVWQTAGVEGGIPFRFDRPLLRVLEPTNSAGLNMAISEVSATASALGGGMVVLKDGIYTIDADVRLKNDVRLVGESRNGVELLITMQTATDAQTNAIAFSQIENAGLERMTIRGNQGTPNPSVMDNVKLEFMVTSVNFYYAKNCWLDGVDIIDSGNHAISAWRSSHVTIRDCLIDGAWNKGGGGRGYVNIMSDRFLVVGNHIRRMRHFALQKEYCEYNVVYGNYLEQDVNFHDDDNGNNLVEANRSALPSTLAGNWHAMMGPWSVVHSISRKDNFIYRNKCVEYNNGGSQVFSDAGVVYLGSRNHEQAGNVFATSSALPRGGTFYPVIVSPPDI